MILKDYCIQEARRIFAFSHTAGVPRTTSAEVKDINDLIVSSTALIILIKSCVDQGLPPTDFVSLVEKLRPRSASNLPLFDNIQETIRFISAGLSSW